MSRVERRIAEAIILAQAASDGGKYLQSKICHVPGTFAEEAKKAWTSRYPEKDRQIRRAIALIQKSGTPDFRFSIVIDKEKKARFIVYFNFTIDGRRGQVSFHSFDKSLERLVSGSQVTSWIEAQRKHHEKECCPEWCLKLGRCYSLF